MSRFPVLIIHGIPYDPQLDSELGLLLRSLDGFQSLQPTQHGYCAYFKTLGLAEQAEKKLQGAQIGSYSLSVEFAAPLYVASPPPPFRRRYSSPFADGTEPPIHQDFDPTNSIVRRFSRRSESPPVSGRFASPLSPQRSPTPRLTHQSMYMSYQMKPKPPTKSHIPIFSVLLIISQTILLLYAFIEFPECRFKFTQFDKNTLQNLWGLPSHSKNSPKLYYIFTSVFVPRSLLDYLFNTFINVLTVIPLEKQYGTFQLFLVFFFGAFVGAVWSVYFYLEDVVAGPLYGHVSIVLYACVASLATGGLATVRWVCSMLLLLAIAIVALVTLFDSLAEYLQAAANADSLATPLELIVFAGVLYSLGLLTSTSASAIDDLANEAPPGQGAALGGLLLLGLQLGVMAKTSQASSALLSTSPGLPVAALRAAALLGLLCGVYSALLGSHEREWPRRRESDTLLKGMCMLLAVGGLFVMVGYTIAMAAEVGLDLLSQLAQFFRGSGKATKLHLKFKFLPKRGTKNILRSFLSRVKSKIEDAID